MPIKKYDPLFGGKGGAQKAKSAMEGTYGKGKLAEKVFYATKNRNKARKSGTN